MDNTRFSGRLFQFWKFSVSHGCLLVRSPSSPIEKSCIDLFWVGVDYVSLPRFLPDLLVRTSSASERTSLEALTGEKIDPPNKAWTLISEGRQFFVVALQLSVREHSDDIFSDPDGWIGS